jgi:hypothetical protein
LSSKSRPSRKRVAILNESCDQCGAVVIRRFASPDGWVCESCRSPGLVEREQIAIPHPPSDPRIFELLEQRRSVLEQAAESRQTYKTLLNRLDQEINQLVEDHRNGQKSLFPVEIPQP